MLKELICLNNYALFFVLYTLFKLKTNMDLTKKAKHEIENRLSAIEDFIADRGVGSTYLTRAKKVQRNVNIALVLGGAITVVGLAAWLLSGSSDDDE